MHRWIALALAAAGTVFSTCTTRSSTAAVPEQVDRAVAVVMPVNDNDVQGTVYFTRMGDKVHVTGEIRGLEPGKHGFHVHQYGDLTDMATGKSLGGHFNPENHPHGKPSDESGKRHVGDLGNIVADEDGVAHIDITDSVISLSGDHSILGRGLVVHADPDDFSQPTGNAGARAGIAVIGVAQPAKSEEKSDKQNGK